MVSNRVFNPNVAWTSIIHGQEEGYFDSIKNLDGKLTNTGRYTKWSGEWTHTKEEYLWENIEK
jgi:hypothetical protein